MLLPVANKMWHQIILVIKQVGKRTLIHVILGFLVFTGTLIFPDHGSVEELIFCNGRALKVDKKYFPTYFAIIKNKNIVSVAKTVFFTLFPTLTI